MNGFALVASVIVAFFTIGIVTGILLVVALPAIQRYRAERRRLRRNRRRYQGRGRLAGASASGR
jgi:hypothetical protein